MKTIIFILASFLFAGELEVDGDLTVLGNVNAPGLGGMKPERIYRTPFLDSSWSSEKIVPEGKVWFITPGGISGCSNQSIDIKSDGEWATQVQNYQEMQTTFLAFSNENIQFKSSCVDVCLLIYEYSISGSGTDQGMNYVEP